MTDRQSPAKHVAYEYVDLGRHTQWLVWMLWAGAAVSLIALIPGYLEYQLLNAFANGEFANEAVATAQAEASDRRQMIMGIMQFSLVIATIVVFGRWIYRACQNVGALSGQVLRFSPGWSVGWYFIPIANFWKPYQAMRQIWHLSQEPRAAPDRQAPELMFGWWALWLLSQFLSNGSFRLTLRAQTIDQFLLANKVTLASDFVDAPSCIVAAFMVAAIYRNQAASALREKGPNNVDPDESVTVQ